MKPKIKFVTVALVGVILAFFAGVSVGQQTERNTPPTTEHAVTFYAAIEEVESWGGNSLLVQGLEVNNWNHRSKYILWDAAKADLIWHGRKIDFSDFKSGQTVSITFDGTVAESYPAQINNIDRIEVLDDKL